MCDVRVATGEVTHDAVDIDLDGLPPFEFKRSYSSSYSAAGPMGRGWNHNWQVSLRADEEAYHIEDPVGGGAIHRFADCDGRNGPRVESDRARGRVSFDYAGGRRLVFAQDQTTAGQWLLRERRDPYGNWTMVSYEAGLPAALRDAQGRNVNFRYDAARLLKEVCVARLGAEQRVRYLHDARGRLVEVVGHLGFATRFDYADDLIVRHANEKGVVRYFGYDERRRCVVNWYEGGLKAHRLDFSPDGGAVVLSDGYGYREVYRLDEGGKPLRMTDPVRRRTEWIYAKDAGLLCKLRPDGSPHMTGTWEDGRRTLVRVDARGTRTVHHFDENGNVTRIENAAGASVGFEHDERGSVTAVVAPGGGRWRYEYDRRGSLSKFTSPKGEWIGRSLSDDGTEVRAWDAAGTLGTFRFDAVGNLASDTDALGRTTAYEYAGQNRLACMTRPDGSTVRWHYDERDHIVGVTDGLGRTTRYEYSPFGSVLKTTEPDGRMRGIVVDKEENLREIFNGRGEVTRLELDENFRTRTITFFDGRVDRQDYDVLNRVSALTDALGRRSRFEYDGANNLERIDFADGAVQRYDYDAVQRMTGVTRDPPPGSGAATKVSEFTFTPSNYVASEAHDGYSVEYGYDAANHLTSARDGIGNDARFTIGRWGQVTRIDDGGRTYGLEYSAAGELVAIRLPNGMSQRLRFDVCSRLVRREVLGRDGRLVAWRDFAYDAADQLVRMEDWRLGAFAYGYDAGGRLVSVARENGPVVERYRYDVEGNVLASPDFAAAALGPGNRLRQADATRFEYDPAGSTTVVLDGGDRWEMEYGYFNQLARLARNGSTVAEYEYDLTGRRTRKMLADEEVRFYHQVNNLRTLESSKLGRWDFLHLPFTFVPIAQSQGGRGYYYSFDQIGTPTELWDDDGNLVATVTSRAFGSGRVVDRAAGAGGVPVPFHFMGQYADDESGLHYNRYRYYSPRTARFTTQDPFGLAAGLNLYAYPRNPMNWVDPLGLAGLTLQINCQPAEPPPFTPCEQAALQTKVAAMNGNLQNQPRKARCTDCRKNQQADYFKDTCKGKVPSGWQVDHIQELQVGGADKCCDNLMAIPQRPNGSCGSQIYHQLKDYGGTVVGCAIAPPGCKTASQCKSDGTRRGTAGPPCEEPAPISCP